MIPKILKQILRHKLITSIILLLIIGGGYFGYQKLAGNKNAVRYVTTAVEKGTLIVSVSGSGQVAALEQVDVKPKVSGEISALYINKDQEVKEDQVLAELDSNDAKNTVRDAQTSLNTAQHDSDTAKANLEQVKTDAERTLATAYEDGYNTVSTIFFKLSGYMKDLKDVLGTTKSEKEYVDSYRLILGLESPFVQKLLDDYPQAYSLYNEKFAFFGEVSRNDNRDTIYQLIGDTLETTKAISQALESARHMFDAIMVRDYKSFNIASQVDTMQPKIESDISSIYSNISSLQQIKETIDDTNTDTPKKIEDAELAIQSAQNTVTQKENALSDAKTALAEHSINAPFNGIIAEINVKKGDSVSAGTALASIITKQKIAEISLNEVDAAKVKVGQKATLTFDALPEVSISGKVTEVDILGQVSQGVVSYKVKISFDTEEEKVKPGMSVTADIITDAKQDVLVLPNGAIKSQGNSKYVELVEVSDDMKQQLLANTSGTILPTPPKSQPVEVGLSNDLSTEIVSGLKEGDIVVTSTISPNKVQTTQTKTNQSRGTQEFRIPGL